MKLAFALLLLIQTPVEPIRIQITAAEESADLGRTVRAELNKRKNVVISSRRADFEIYLVSAPITQEKQVIVGYAVASLVIESRPARQADPFKLWVFVGPTLEDVSRRFVARLERESFKQKAGR